MIDWLADNWLWLGFGGLFVWMHTRHGGCGAHHGHDHHDHDDQLRGHDEVGSDAPPSPDLGSPQGQVSDEAAAELPRPGA